MVKSADFVSRMALAVGNVFACCLHVTVLGQLSLVLCVSQNSSVYVCIFRVTVLVVVVWNALLSNFMASVMRH